MHFASIAGGVWSFASIAKGYPYGNVEKCCGEFQQTGVGEAQCIGELLLRPTPNGLGEAHGRTRARTVQNQVRSALHS